MGFLDNVKKGASKAASDAGRAAKVGQAQMKVKSLNGDIEGVKKEMGVVTYDLIDKGELSNSAFDEHIAKIRAIQAQIVEKEAEIAALKAEAAAPAASESDASEQ